MCISVYNILYSTLPFSLDKILRNNCRDLVLRRDFHKSFGRKEEESGLIFLNIYYNCRTSVWEEGLQLLFRPSGLSLVMLEQVLYIRSM